MSSVLTLFGELITFLLGQVTGLFTAITGDTLLYTIVLIVFAISICGTIIAILRKLGLRSRKGRRRGRRAR